MNEKIKCYACSGVTSGFWFAGEATRKEWKGRDKWDVYRCSFCNHKVVHPMLTFDDLQPYYDSSYAPYSQAEHDKQRNTYLKEYELSKKIRGVQVDPNLSYLDVGCGAGGFLGALSELGCRVQGVEPSEHGAAICEENGVPVFNGFLSDFIEQRGDTFDIVTCNHVVEHHPDPKQVLRELGSRLNKGGKLVFAVPNAASFFAEALTDRWHSFDLPVHVHHFSQQSLVLCVEEAGLKAIECRTESENSLPGALAVLLRQRIYMPGRITRALFTSLLSKNGFLGRYIDNKGYGEALIVTAIRSTES